ncbi:hypothetical protein IX41_03535 [Kocuria rhizophila]|nr:hypothetical protein IX41_03535 [Kocuria rhizophila]
MAASSGSAIIDSIIRACCSPFACSASFAMICALSQTVTGKVHRQRPSTADGGYRVSYVRRRVRSTEADSPLTM